MVFISVHVGAGFHKSEQKYTKCLLDSVSKGKSVLENGGTALDAVTAAIEVLENDGITNCGLGSALNLKCEVQCDASLMQSSDLNWAGIGAVSKIKNPILVAKNLIIKQQNKNEDNLINSCFLVGEGAESFAQKVGCSKVDNLVTEASLNLFKKHYKNLKSTKNFDFENYLKRKRDFYSDEPDAKKKILDDHQYCSILENVTLDTVGAIAIDNLGNIVSGVSSGGIMFKDEGRIGQASVYGSGCWSENNVGVSTTGVGEYLIKTLLAKKIAKKLNKSNEGNSWFDNNLNGLEINLKKNFLESIYLKKCKNNKLFGILCLVNNQEFNKLQLLWAHNTPSMFIAYSLNNKQTELIFSKFKPTDINLINNQSIVLDYK